MKADNEPAKVKVARSNRVQNPKSGWLCIRMSETAKPISAPATANKTALLNRKARKTKNAGTPKIAVTT